MKLTLENLGLMKLMERTYYAICEPIDFNSQQCMFVEVKNNFHLVVKLDRSKKMSIWQILKSSTGQLLNKLR